MRCYFCDNETNGKQFLGTNILTGKEDTYNICDDCCDEDLEIF